MNTAPTLLVIGYVWPEPASSAAGSHMMSLLRLFLSKGWQVTFASPAQRNERSNGLEAAGIRCEAIALNCSSFDRFVSKLAPSAVLFDRFMMEEQFGWRVDACCPNALKSLDTEDLHSLRAARHTAHKQNSPVTAELLNGEQAQREIASIYRCDLSLIISEYELELLTQHYGVPRFLLWHLPFMLDLSQANQGQPFEQRSGYISIGNFRHAPNWDAVLWLKQQVWPAIRAKHKGATLSVYGAYAPPKATALHNPKEGFHVLGWADSAFEVMANARVCLAPLRFGAGIKGKLVDAMMTGTPSVTTDIGAESMHGELPWPGEVHNEVDAFAEAAVNLHQSGDAWHAAQAKASPILKARYDQEQLGEALYQKVTETLEHLTQHRLNNFTGALLKHHQHRSTQFMSQWIEVKTELAALKGSPDEAQ